jgi:hypothetical protein
MSSDGKTNLLFFQVSYGTSKLQKGNAKLNTLFILLSVLT